MGRLRSYLLLTLVLGVLAGWAAAIDSGRLFDTWAFLKDVESDTNNTITAGVLRAPSGLTAAANGVTQIDLTWTASPDSYATGYLLFRRLNPGSYGSGTALTETQTNCSAPGDSSCAYSDTTVSGGLTYCYQVRATYLNWTSPLSNENCATTESPISSDPLYLSSPNGTKNTLCSSLATALVESGASGTCKVESTTHPPFAFASWCRSGNVEANKSGWVLTLVLDTSNPFQQATLSAELSLGTTVIATSGAFVVNQSGPSTVNVNLTPTVATPPASGQLCLKITNQTIDSNPNSGAAHDAKIVTTGGSKIHGPWDPWP